MRLDGTDPHRTLVAPVCSSNGEWCRHRWLYAHTLCTRAARAPRTAERDGPCPDLRETITTVYALVGALAARDPDDATAVVLDGAVYSAQACMERWAEKPPSEEDVLDYASRTGRCAACAWACPVCCRARPSDDCRAHNGGNCCLAEDHTARCTATQIKWLSTSDITLHDRPLPKAPVVSLCAYRARTRRGMRRLVRKWARAETKRLRQRAPD